MLSAFRSEAVEFIIVGGYAVAAHGYPRATGDIDLWVRPSLENSKKIYRALEKFGALLSDLRDDYFSVPDQIFQIGLPPSRIDIISGVEALGFDEAWAGKFELEVEGVKVWMLSKKDLMINKAALKRPKDRIDLEWLKESEAD